MKKVVKWLAKMLAEEAVKAAATNAFEQIGRAVGTRLARKIDPEGNYGEPSDDEDDAVEEDEKVDPAVARKIF